MFNQKYREMLKHYLVKKVPPHLIIAGCLCKFENG